MCADQRWDSGRFWFSEKGGKDTSTDWAPLGFDVLIRPVVRYVVTYANDIGMLSIDAPPAFIRSGIGQTPRATVKNHGTAVASFTVTCVIDSEGTNPQNLLS